MANKERKLQFDIAKVLAIMWIVACWHVYDYNPEYRSLIVNDYTYMLSKLMNGVFMFSSGFFMSQYYSFRNINDIKCFYFKRFWRVYPLYAVAAITLYGCGFIDNSKVLLTTLTGTSPYILPQPSTLWFVSLLISFYILTPLLFVLCERFDRIQLKDEIKYVLFLLLNFSIFSFLYWIYREYNAFDERFAVYFPIYFWGYYSGRNSIFERLTRNKSTSFLLMVISLIAISFAESFNTMAKFSFIVFGILGLLSFTALLSEVSWTKNKVIFKLSYATMCIYLFHRLWFTCADMFFEGEWYIPLWCVYIVVIPFTILAGYYLQKFYDKLVQSGVKSI